ncbi:hypothetical protein [Poseidonibacter lekithochrous]|uniref:hypothetical protein n=1 Tax=Poseidonibacter lekithochrous TaxID=1904463 RepID=UPI0008FC3FB4|nr:hypothetical protein [Poseidonibacter lekithochrous]QKJ24170.1 hypothetical protein ALEK_2958 [Poseidonibacter lekithochrous]
MSVIFESRIKCNKTGGVYIELKDLVDGRVEICKDIEEYSTKIEKLGEDYGGQIDEVKWFVDEGVPQEELNQIRMDMDKIKEDMDKAKEGMDK